MFVEADRSWRAVVVRLNGMLSGKVGGTLPPWNFAPLLAGGIACWAVFAYAAYFAIA